MNRFQPSSLPSPGEGAGSELKEPAYCPPAPRDCDDLKISHSVLRDLMLRHLRTHGVSSFRSLSGTMKISPSIVQHLFEEMRQQQMLHVKGRTGLDYSFDLTEAGRAFAAERTETSKYAGPVPVSLNEYFHAVGLQAAKVKVNRTDLRTAFADLVVPDALLDQLGPALVSQRSLFLYGPTGNGKTSYSERLTRIYRDSILVPHALEVDGQIITVYDPVVHHRLNVDDANLDPRWVVCQRPCVIVGGELVSSMFDLRSDESSGTYVAPLQVKANNGILVIDDLGRQNMHPRELLNRCMTPLARRIDYLNLSYGIKFEIPFELLVVFSTNLSPGDLADEAFLRRIPNKVYVDNIDDQTFDVIFEREAAKQEIAWNADIAETVRRLCKLHGSEHLRACYPGDICSILHWISEYEGRPIETTEAELDRAVMLYFTRSQGRG
jgi:predicted ATPase with chaperone activity